MERVEKIRTQAVYQDYYDRIRQHEKDRIFCHHDMGHFLDVARLANILAWKEGLQIKEDVIYATALLHDIGRFRQYEDGTPHQIESASLAEPILIAAGYEEIERKAILSAILNHRNREIEKEASLDGIIYRADKMSRSCFACEAEHLCDWKADKKNLQIVL